MFVDSYFDLCKSCYYWLYVNEGICSYCCFSKNMLFLNLEFYWSIIDVLEIVYIDVEFDEFW